MTKAKKSCSNSGPVTFKAHTSKKMVQFPSYIVLCAKKKCECVFVRDLLRVKAILVYTQQKSHKNVGNEIQGPFCTCQQ